MKLIITAGFFFFAIAPTALCQTDSIYTFSPDVKITESGQYDGTSFGFASSGGHYTAYRGDTVYVIWQETRYNPYNTWILFARSNDGGMTFGPNVIAAGGVDPSMRVDSAGIIYLAYQNSGDIFFRKSTNGGAGFSARVRVTDDTVSQTGQELPSISVNNKGQIFVTWLDYRTDPYSAFASVSFDDGLTFTPNVQVNEPGTSGAPGDIAADDTGKVYVSYGGVLDGRRGLIVARSIDSGQSFTYRTFADDSLWEGGYASLAVLGQLIGAAWTGTRVVNNNLEITMRFSVSLDCGQTFSTGVRVDNDSDLTLGTNPSTPSLAYRNGVFYVAWMRPDVLGPSKILFSYTIDNGQSFAPNVDVNANTTDPNNQFRQMSSLAVNEEGKAFVAWSDGRYIGQVGDTWLLFGAPGEFVQLLKGDLNLDEVLTATDVVLELNAVFSGQTFPAPFRNADGNCSGNLTPTDVVLLLNAVFLNVPFPCY